MAITFGVATAAGTTTASGRGGDGTLTIPLPTSWAVGDFAILLVYLDAGTCSVTTPATGWTEVSGSPWGTSTPKLRAFYRFLQAGDGDPIITVAGSSGTLETVGAIATFRGVNTGTPIEAVGTASVGTGTPITAAQISTLTNGAWALGLCGRGDNEAFSTETFGGSATGVSERLDAGEQAGGDDGQVCIYSKEIASYGATGAGSAASSTTDPWVSVLIALKPAPAPFTEDILSTIVSVAAIAALQTFIEILLETGISAALIDDTFHFGAAGKFKDRDSGPSFGDRTNDVWSRDTSVQTETLTDLAVSASTVADVQTFLEALAVVITSLDSLTEIRQLVDNLVSTISSQSAIAAIQTYLAMVSDVASSASSVQEVQAYVAVLSDTAISVASLNESYGGPHGPKFYDRVSGPSFGDRTSLAWDKPEAASEVLTSIAISASSIQDKQTFLQTLLTTIHSIDSLIDAKGLVENLLSQITSQASATVVQHYVTALLDVASSVSTIQALQAFIQSLMTTVTSVSTVSDSKSTAGRELKFTDRPEWTEWQNRLLYVWDKEVSIEENLSDVAMSVSAVTSLQTYKESRQTTGISSSQITAMQNYLAVLSEVIQSITSLSDRQIFLESLLTTIQSQVSVLDAKIGNLSEVLTTVAQSASSEVDRQNFLDSVLTSIASVSTISDKEAYLDILSSLTASGTSVSDLKIIIENLQTVAISVSSISDQTAMIENLQTLIQSQATISDLQAYVETLQTTVTSGSSIRDLLTGEYYEELLSTIVSRASVEDTYQKGTLIETGPPFYFDRTPEFELLDPVPVFLFGEKAPAFEFQRRVFS